MHKMSVMIKALQVTNATLMEENSKSFRFDSRPRTDVSVFLQPSCYSHRSASRAHS